MLPKPFYLRLVSCSLPLVLFSCQSNQPDPSKPKPPTHAAAKSNALLPKSSTSERTFPAGTEFRFLSQHNKNKELRDSAKSFLKSLSPSEKSIVIRLNRVDATTLGRLDTLVIPNTIDTNWMSYCIFPQTLPILKDVHRMIIFAYYQEAFAAYENGQLVHWGPTNMGKKASPTPTGLFFTNWKAKETISTVNDEWKLKWNFNLANYAGVGFHQYQLPGYPASHSCLRLQEADAMYLYNWAQQWIVRDGQLLAKGTPVWVYGVYPFGKSKPWWSLVKDPKALTISADTLNAMLQPQLDKIISAQQNRDKIESSGPQPKIDTATTSR